MALLKIDASLISANNVANSYVVTASDGITSFQPFGQGYPIVCNDISTRFDGLTTTLPIMVEQDYINTIADSRNLQVSVSGQYLAPYVTTQTFPWITEYDSFKGFRLRGSNITIYNPPDAGEQAVVTIVSNNSTVQTRKYPYSATTIALGD
jgi:hypothetical protein